MLSAKISSRGEVTLPRRIRKVLQVKPGDRVTFEIEDQTVVVRSLGTGRAKALAGGLRRYGGTKASASAVRESVKKKVTRGTAQEG